MGESKNDAAIIKAAGKSNEEWFAIIQKSRLSKLTHKELAACLHQEYNLSFQRAQQITVLYEKEIGKRKTGQTQNSGFQIGVSRTLNMDAEELWRTLISPEVFELISGAKILVTNISEHVQTSPAGIEYKVTTFIPGSHMRMRWRLPQWDSYSILQVRITRKAKNKSVLTFHQEKLESESIRNEMKQYWQKKINCLEVLVHKKMNVS